MACLVAIGTMLAVIPLFSALVPALVLFGVAGFFNGPLGSSVSLVLDSETPSDAHTQVFTFAAGVKVSAAALGTACAGLVAGIGSGKLLLAIAGSQLLAAGIGTLSLRTSDD
ncbi:MAG: hypothetical protein ACR2OE_02220 [Thermomicrobiales bacterium]